MLGGMVQQTHTVQVRLPAFTQYNRPLFAHNLDVILGKFREGTMSISGGSGQAGETLTITVPTQITAKDVVGYAGACLRATGIDGEAELIK